MDVKIDYSRKSVFTKGVVKVNLSRFPLGEKVDDPVQMYLSDVYTVTANLAGIPALSLPVGYVDGLPVGGQFMAPWWAEETLTAAGAALEASVGAAS